MGQYDFTYEFPSDFSNRVMQLLQQYPAGNLLAMAFQRCKYEHHDKGNAHRAGVPGDMWDRIALDFIIEGASKDITLLTNRKLHLHEAISLALRSSTTGYVARQILFITKDEVSALPRSDDSRLNADIAKANEVLRDLLTIASRLCSNVLYRNATEDSINDYFRDMLSQTGYSEVKDQTRHGISSSGNDAGEVDILITKDGKEIGLFEGLILDCVNSSYIDTHIKKAILNYNASGTATFIVAYVTASNFQAFWDRYIAHIQAYEFTIPVKMQLSVKVSPNAAVKIADMILSRDGFDFPVYFLALNLN